MSVEHCGDLMEQGNENQKAKSSLCDFEKSLNLFKQELSQVDRFLCPVKGVCMLINTSTSSTSVSSWNSSQLLAHDNNTKILNPYLILILEKNFQLFCRE